MTIRAPDISVDRMTRYRARFGREILGSAACPNDGPRMANVSDEERLKELAKKKQAIEAWRTAIRPRVAKRERARDMRRKILVGSLFLLKMENNPENGPRFRVWLKKKLPGFLRETGHALFDDIIEEDTEGD
ncbi:MAG: hypothetical protein OXF88_13515 [Rhodobacteraceae bacterium]|nr:hypothetical protein [Paracoccaceae bacterium]MCY4138932.1 hypothetical protein [Paracoccaceae bacterium]